MQEYTSISINTCNYCNKKQCFGIAYYLTWGYLCTFCKKLLTESGYMGTMGIYDVNIVNELFDEAEDDLEIYDYEDDD